MWLKIPPPPPPPPRSFSWRSSKLAWNCMGTNPNTCSSAVLVLGQTVKEEKNKQVMNRWGVVFKSEAYSLHKVSVGCISPSLSRDESSFWTTMLSREQFWFHDNLVCFCGWSEWRKMFLITGSRGIRLICHHAYQLNSSTMISCDIYSNNMNMM